MTPRREVIRSFPLAGFFTALRVNLNPHASAHLDQRVGFSFPDTGEAFTIHVRRGVAGIKPDLKWVTVNG